MARDRDICDSANVYRDMSAIFVEHPKHEAALAAARSAVLLSAQDDEAPCLQISGPPGVGKSTLRAKLLVEFPRQRRARVLDLPRQPGFLADYVPLLAFDMPTRPTVKTVAKAMLRALRDPEWERGDEFSLTCKVDLFIEACGTQGILIDEAHRAIDRGGVVIAANLAEWLTARHSANPTSLILLGLGRVKHLFRDDLQLEADGTPRCAWSLILGMTKVMRML